jgi:hypothetical protein
MDGTPIISFLQTVKSVKEIGTALIGLKVTGEVQAKIIELNNLIIAAQGHAASAQQENAALVTRISELEKEIANQKTSISHNQNYELKEVDVGALCYVLKEYAQTSEPPHWLCQPCFSKGHRNILQKDTFEFGNKAQYVCNTCKFEISVSREVSPSS